MSVSEFFRKQQEFIRFGVEISKEAIIMMANPAGGSCETMIIVALFDSSEDAIAYEKKARLIEPSTDESKIYQTYRTDSLLYDYNPPWHSAEADEETKGLAVEKEMLFLPDPTRNYKGDMLSSAPEINPVIQDQPPLDKPPYGVVDNRIK